MKYERRLNKVFVLLAAAIFLFAGAARPSALGKKQPEERRVRILTEVNRVVRKRVVVCYYHKYYLSYILRSLKKMVGIGKSRRKNPGGRVGYADLMKETAAAGLKIRKVTPLAPIVSGNCVVEMQPTTRKAQNTKS